MARPLRRRARIGAPRGALALAGTVGLLVLGGCGTQGGPNVFGYRDAANGLCRNARPELVRLADRVQHAQRGSHPDGVFGRVAALKARQAATARRLIDRLDLLPTPAAQRDDLNSWVEAERRQQTLVEALGRAFHAHDETAISTLSQRIDTLDAANDAAAVRLGVAACAREPG